MLIALIVVLAAAPGPGEPRYSTVNLTPEILAKVAEPELARQATGFAKQFKVTKIERAGKTVWSAADAATDALPDVPKAERTALLAFLQRAGMQGAETDVLIDQGETLLPVQITWDASGVISYEVGAPVKDLLAAATTAAKVKEKFPDVGDFTEDGGKWAPGEIDAVFQALSLLTPEELALAKGFGFRRIKAARGPMAAFYNRSDNGAFIDVSDVVFAARRTMFLGKVGAPVAEAVHLLLHELAHAIADAQGRALALSANAAVNEFKAQLEKSKTDDAAKTGLKEKNVAAAELRKKSIASDKADVAAGGRAVEKEFAKVLEPAKSVTTYGRTNATENFAEAFFLVKTDPEAVKRISPAVLEWFGAGKHVVIAGKQ